MPSISILHAETDQALGDKIAKALGAEGHDATCIAENSPADAFDPTLPAVVIWSPSARDAAQLFPFARASMEEGAPVPVSIAGAIPPDEFAHLQPVDLTGWNGDGEDPRWRFVVDEINLAAQRDLLKDGDVWPDGEEPELCEAETSVEVTPGETHSPQPIAASVAIAYAPQGPHRPEVFAAEPREHAPEKPLTALRDVIQGELFMDESASPGFPDAPPPPQGFRPLHVMAAGALGLTALAAGVFFAAPLFINGAPSGPETIAEQGAEKVSPDASQQLEATVLEAPEVEDIEAGTIAFVEFLTPIDQPMLRETPLEPEDSVSEGEGDVSTPEASGPPLEFAATEEAAEEVDSDEALELALLENAPSAQDAPGVAPSNLTADEAPPEPSVEAVQEAEIPPNDQLEALVAEAAYSLDTDEIAAPEAAETAYLGNYFRECVECPDMAALPAGSFLMGAPATEKAWRTSEGPVTEITIARPFAIGTREVTFKQWDACVADGGCSGYAPSDNGWGRKNQPAINVSFEDAQAYVAWLSAKTRQNYRLPTEAEWEYAARAGTRGAFAFGEGIDATKANFNGEYIYNGPKTRYRRRTTPAASFAPNAFGLFDMHGNVWEWTADCWSEDHSFQPVDGSGRTGACASRVLKGGAWNTGGWRLRSAHRISKAATVRENDNGFRVARDLD